MNYLEEVDTFQTSGNSLRGNYAILILQEVWAR